METKVQSHTYSFLISTIINKKIYHKPTIVANIHLDVYVAFFLNFYILLHLIPQKDKNSAISQIKILPTKFIDEFELEIWDKIIMEFYKIVQGKEVPIREGKPIGMIVHPVETLQKDGTIKVDSNSTPRQSQITIPIPPIDSDKYKEFLKKYV